MATKAASPSASRQGPTKRATSKASAAPSVLEGTALVRADRAAARGKATNEIDERIKGVVNMDVISRGYFKPSERPSSSGRYAALKAYFKPETGTAEKEGHDIAVNMIDYMNKFIEPRVVTRDGHPAKGQLGVFAREDIPADTVLGMYGGLVTSSAQADMEHRQKNTCLRSIVDTNRVCRFYIWKTAIRASSVAQLAEKAVRDEFAKLRYKGPRKNVTSEAALEVLGSHHGNALRFINGYQGVARHDNVVVLTVWWKGAPRIVYLSRLPIAKGDEVLSDYGTEHSFDEESRSDASSSVEDPETGEFLVEAVVDHRSARKPDRYGNTLEFLVQWSNGRKKWTPVCDLVEVDYSVPNDPYIFNDKFYTYLLRKKIPTSLLRCPVRGDGDDDSEFSITEEDEEEVVADAVDKKPTEAVAVTATTTRPTTQKKHNPPSKEEKAIVAATVPGAAIHAEVVAAQKTAGSIERVVDAIDDMHHLGDSGGYEFHVIWDDGTTSWTRTENLVDEDERKPGDYIYTAALIRYLDSIGIKDYAAIVKRAVVPVRILRHVYGPVTSRQRPPAVQFHVAMSSGSHVLTGLLPLVNVLVDPSGNKRVQYKDALAAYVKKLEGDDEFQRFLKASVQSLLGKA